MFNKRGIFNLNKFAVWLGIGVAALGWVGIANAADYVFQPGDTLSLQVDGESSLTKTYTVSDQGDIILDTVGKVHVAGLTVKGSEDELTNQLKKYYKLFEVHVSSTEETGGRVLVFGEVAKPGSVKVRPDAKLLDVLAEAGQPTANADTKRISIIRHSGGKTETINLDAVLKDPSLNVPLAAGDTLTVPSRLTNTVQVDGEVRSPGLRPLDNFKTAYAAVMSAGPLDSADWKRIALRRGGSSTPLLIDLSAVRTGQLKDDIELQPGDQITLMSRYRGMATLRGEVKDPGEKPLNGQTQLLDFIRISGGGFTDIADASSIEILREGQPVQKVNLEEVANGQRNSDDPKLAVLPGDVIFVPNDEKKRFAIVGGVKKPGAYPVKPGMTLMDAIFLAEGFSPTASLKEIVLAPADPNDDRFKAEASDGDAAPAKTKATAKTTADEPAIQSGLVLLDYKKIQTGEISIPLRPGDRILIPEEFARQPKRNGLDTFLRMVPLASLFLLRR